MEKKTSPLLAICLVAFVIVAVAFAHRQGYEAGYPNGYRAAEKIFADKMPAMLDKAFKMGQDAPKQP